MKTYLLFIPAIWVLMGCSSTTSSNYPENSYTDSLSDDMNTFDPSASSSRNTGGSQLSIRQGQFFSYALPPGWRVMEDGQFAVVLVAPDNAAVTIMVGNSGLPLNYPPAQYLYERLMAAGYTNLQLSQPRQGTPVAGCQYAYTFDYTYSVNGVPCRGQATCSVAPSYDMCTMIATCAASQNNQWASYASWLPQVAGQVAATNGAAFGMRGIMQQNLQNSTAYGEAARQYREWSQQNWQQVTDQRNQSQDRNNQQFRENLGGVQTYTNPYDSRAVELPTTHSYYWINRQGTTWGTNDPSENPNNGSTQEWVRMQKN
ncbi:MAG: hypothetical protein SF052_14445 [Bacteroidia bacterium]|nr:hypothetical protein [Bacteroidia bacterium]